MDQKPKVLYVFAQDLPEGGSMTDRVCQFSTGNVGREASYAGRVLG